MQHKNPYEVRSTPEKDKYIQRSIFKDYVVKPVARRVTWAISCVLSVGAVVPLAFKMTVHVIDGVLFDRKSLKEARKNLAGAIALPLAGGVSSLASVLPIPTAIPYSPSKLGAYLVKSLLVSIRIILAVGKGNLAHFIRTKDMTVKSSTGEVDYPLEWKVPKVGLLQFHLPKAATFSSVQSYKQQRIDTVDLLAETQTKHWRIVFLAAAEVYETNFNRYEHESKDMNCNTRTFNYPGLFNIDEMDSMDDYVNAGIAEVYALAKQQDWSNQDIEKNLHFYAYCFGGGVAFHVAAYFKMKHNVDILVFADRSYSSLVAASANLIAAVTGLPQWYSRLMCRSFLYAGGELNLDSVAAIKKLNPKCVLPFNLTEIPADTPKDCGKKAKYILGVGKPAQSADVILRDDAVLMSVLKRETQFCDTSKMFRAMGFCDEPRVFSNPSPHPLGNGHFTPFNLIQFQCREINGTGFQFYRQAITAVLASNDRHSQETQAVCRRS